MQESVCWMLQRVLKLGAVRGNLRGERMSGEIGGVCIVGEEKRSDL